LEIINENIRKIPFVRFIIPFILGILSGNYLNLDPLILIIASFIILLLLIIFHFNKKINAEYSFGYIFGILLSVFLFLAGASEVSIKKLQYGKRIPETFGKFIALVIETPDTSGQNVQTIILIEGQSKEKTKAYLQKDLNSLNIKLGDKIFFSGKIKSINKREYSNFDIQKYYKYNGIYSEVYLKSNNWKLLSHNNLKDLKWLANKIKDKFLNILKQSLNNNIDFSVASALTIGDKTNIDTGLKSAYINAGVIHILCVSGLHVGIIYIFLQFILNFVFKIRFGQIFFAIINLIFIWIYAFITGLATPVTRAAIMISFIIIGKALKKPVNTYNSIAASAFIILLSDPYAIFQTGFQLSYLAVLSIIYWYKKIYLLFLIKNKFFDKIWQLVCISISAQIFVLPITFYQFHQFSNFFIFANLIATPLSAIIIYLSIMLIPLSFFPFLINIFGFITSIAIEFLNKYIDFINKLPFSITSPILFNNFHLLITLLLIICIILIIETRYKIFINIATGILLIAILYNLNLDYKISNQVRITNYKIKDNTVIQYFKGTNSLIITDLKKDEKNLKMINTIVNYNSVNYGIKNHITVFVNGNDQNISYLP